jgi:MFS family permease
LVPVYIREVSPREISGLTGSLNQFSICFGILSSFLLGLTLPLGSEVQKEAILFSTWRPLFLLPALTCVIRVFNLMFFFSFETPLYLCTKSQEREAEKFLLMIYGKNQEKATDILKNIIEESLSNKSNDISYNTLFCKPYTNRMLLAILLSVSQQTSGINAVTFYSNKIFESSLSPPFALVFTILTGVLMTVAALLSGKLIDKSGRRSLWLSGMFFCALILLFLSFFKNLSLEFMNKYLILLFVFSFGISLGPILSVYVTEILPEKGMSVACIFNWMMAFFIGLIFPKLINSSLQLEGTFFLFSFITFSAFFILCFKMRETKDVPTNQIPFLFDENYVPLPTSDLSNEK